MGVVLISIACTKQVPTGGINLNEGMVNHYNLMKSGMAEAENNFGMGFFSLLAEKMHDQNIVLSPHSVSLELAMFSCGSCGQTRDEIVSALGLDGYSKDMLGDYYFVLNDRLKSSDPSVSFIPSNSVWMPFSSVSLKQDFVTYADNYFGVQYKNTDGYNPFEVQSKVNSWISEQTKGQINNFLIYPVVKDVNIYNALYFNAKWSASMCPSKKLVTADWGVSEPVQTEYIEFDASLRYSKNEYSELVELKYGDNGNYSFVAVLPSENVEMADVIADLGTQEGSVSERLANAYKSDILLYLPEFCVDFECELKDLLYDYGMPTAFGLNPDFTGIADNFNGSMSMKHKSVIEVTKEGTTAASASGEDIPTSPEPGETYVLRLNRPFLFFIYENTTGSILYAGHLVNPKE